MSYTFEEKHLDARTVVTIRRETTHEGLAQAFGEILPAIAGAIHAAGGQMASPPFGMYHTFNPPTVDLEAGAAVVASIDTEGDMRCYELPACKVISLMHVGPYDDLGEAHAALQSYVTEKGLKRAGPPAELYWTDPGAEPDSSKWKTELQQAIL